MIGDKIKQLRKRKGLTLKELAAIIPSSPGFISEIENGVKMPGSEFLLSLKRIFDVDMNWLMSSDDQDVSEPIPEYRSGPQYDSQTDMILKMLKDMPEEQREKVRIYAEDQKRLANYLATLSGVNKRDRRGSA